MIPELKIQEKANVTDYLYFEWLALKREDIVSDHIYYNEYKDLDKDFMVRIEEATNGNSDLYINVDFDFT